MDRPKGVKRGCLAPRSLILLVVLFCAGLAASVGTFLTLHGSERNQQRTAMEQEAEEHFATLQKVVDKDLLALELLGRLYAGSEKVKRDEFHEFTKPIPKHLSCLQALEWAPRVQDADRAAYEETVRQEGFPAFQITERDPDGRLVRAARREEYFPVDFIGPAEGNEPAHGYDLTSNAVRREAMEKACDTAEMRGTPPVRLVQETGDQAGVLVFLPVYRNGTSTESVEARRANLEGFVLGVFRAGDLLERAMSQSAPRGLDVALYDMAAPVGERLLAWHPSRLRRKSAKAPDEADVGLPGTVHYSASLQAAGRTWFVHCTPSPEFSAGAGRWHPWEVLIGGLAFTGLLTGYFATMLRRTAHVEHLADRLLESNEKLETEVQERKQAEEAILRFQFMVENAAQEVYLVEPDGRLVYVNRAAAASLGYTVEEMLALGVPGFDPKFGPVFRQHFEDLKARREDTRDVSPFETVHIAKDGRRVAKEMRSFCLRLGEREYVCGFGQDVTERKRADKALEEANRRLGELATMDALTGLANRRRFMEMLDAEFKRSQRYGTRLALAMVDVDQFKRFNDAYGHAFGDRVLAEVAKRLAAEARQTDLAARLAGDEFVILMPETSPDEAVRAAERIRKTVSKNPISDGKRSVSATVSVGIGTIQKANAGTPESLLKQADDAMYAAKEAGRDRVCLAPAEKAVSPAS